jgi:hypothetical protein
MLKPNHEWKVLPQGTSTEIDSGIRAPEGATLMPLIRIPRRLRSLAYVEGKS